MREWRGKIHSRSVLTPAAQICDRTKNSTCGELKRQFSRMKLYDVFNGDADGLCALQQIRLAEPAETTLVTGVKRDIALLQRVDADNGDRITVLDISLDKNREALLTLLARGAVVRYFDHHFPGEDVPRRSNLELHLETAPDKGTSLLVDEYLGGRYRAWAVVGTFGDNFDHSAQRAARSLGLADADLLRMRDLGIYLNYNGYGAAVEDLHFQPDELFRRLRPYADPLEFSRLDGTFAQLESGYRDDMSKAAAVRAELETERHGLYLLPSESWARRVSGVLANRLAQGASGRAHALLTRLPDGGFVVSVRAPLDTRQGADELCRRFPSGGGRKAAAGINRLAESDYDAFVRAFTAAF